MQHEALYPVNSNKLSRFELNLDFRSGFPSDILMLDERKGTEIPIPFVFLLQKNSADVKASACDESHRSGAFFMPEIRRQLDPARKESHDMGI